MGKYSMHNIGTKTLKQLKSSFTEIKEPPPWVKQLQIKIRPTTMNKV